MTRWFQLAAAVLVFALVVGLYRAKTDAGAARTRVRALESEITETQADIRALRAETAALETPARVEALAKQELRLQVGRQGVALPERALETTLPAPRSGQSK